MKVCASWAKLNSCEGLDGKRLLWLIIGNKFFAEGVIHYEDRACTYQPAMFLYVLALDLIACDWSPCERIGRRAGTSPAATASKNPSI